MAFGLSRPDRTAPPPRNAVPARFGTLDVTLVELPMQMLRGDVIAIVAAAFIASLGVASLALYALRKRAADVTPLAFAAFALIYALRLAIATRTVQAALSESGGPWGYIDAALTYAILPGRRVDR